MSAIISECGRYRYRLERQVAPMFVTKPVMFIGVNPSTADALTDDATIRKMIGFTQRWGYSSFMVGNVFAWRSTDVKQLPDRSLAVGPENMHHLRAMLDEAACVIPCWGDTHKVPKTHRVQFEIVRALLQLTDTPVKCFGYTNGNDPLHPLMLAYSTEMRDWRR